VLTKKPYDEKKVLELLAQGSEYAFTQLFDHHRGRIYRVGLKFLKSSELAEEVVQEVFLKIWLKRTELKQVLNFEAYLFTIARNHIFDGIKDVAEEIAAKKEFAHTISHVSGTDNPILEKQYETLLQNAVDQLPPQQKQVFTLSKVEGLSHQVIAEQLQISRLTVKKHMAKALQTIRLRLQHHITTVIFMPLIIHIFEQMD
jgi:RNA polymerase sigma-70 factor (family 1)